MNIGVIVYSDTGNTLSVATQLKDKLAAAGHAATLVRLKAQEGYRPGQTQAVIGEWPSLDRYQALVFAAPVNAFALSQAMKAYLRGIGPLGGRKTALLVTQFFPFAWMGGNQAVAWMRRACRKQGGEICGAGIVNWSRRDREQRIRDTVDRLAGCLTG